MWKLNGHHYSPTKTTAHFTSFHLPALETLKFKLTLQRQACGSIVAMQISALC